MQHLFQFISCYRMISNQLNGNEWLMMLSSCLWRQKNSSIIEIEARDKDWQNMAKERLLEREFVLGSSSWK